jgi:hypothetical protein
VLSGRYVFRAICHAEGRKEKGSSDKASRIASFTSSRPSFLGDNEAFSEFRPKIASLLKFVIFRYEMTFS